MRFRVATGVCRYTLLRSLLTRCETSFNSNALPRISSKFAVEASRNAQYDPVGFEIAATAEQYRGMRRFRQGSAAFILAVVSTLAAGCGIPHDIGLAERCADLMQSAYPSAQIEITKSDAAATSLTTIIAHVEGSRSDVPPDGPSARDLAVECRFDENVLTGFHWTAGPTR